MAPRLTFIFVLFISFAISLSRALSQLAAPAAVFHAKLYLHLMFIFPKSFRLGAVIAMMKSARENPKNGIYSVL